MSGNAHTRRKARRVRERAAQKLWDEGGWIPAVRTAHAHSHRWTQELLQDWRERFAEAAKFLAKVDYYTLERRTLSQHNRAADLEEWRLRKSYSFGLRLGSDWVRGRVDF